MAGQQAGEAQSGQSLDNVGEAQSDTDRVLAVGGEIELNLGVVLSRYKVLPLSTGVQQNEVISLRDDLS